MSQLLRSLLPTVLVVVTAFSASAEDAALSFKGSGTQDDPWQISSKADVLELAKACNGDGIITGPNCSHYANKYFILTADIDMSGVSDFYGIAAAPKGLSSAISFKFQGNFDGQNHTIRNMVIKGVDFDSSGKALAYSKDGSRKYCGFFGTVEGGVIKNLNIDSSCTIEGWGAVGSVVGQAYAGARVQNCTSSATVIAYDAQAGGIVGYAYGSKSTTSVYVADCYFSGEVKMNYHYAGGIIGEGNYAFVTGCSSTGSVELSGFNLYKASGLQEYGGGIAGGFRNGGITECFSATFLKSQGKYNGGIAGIMGTTSAINAASMSRCVSIGSIIGSDIATKGGLAGFAKVTASTPTPLSQCYYDTSIWGTTAVGGTEYSFGLSTEELTNGDLPAGLTASKWVVEKGFYPRNKAFDSALERAAAATYVVFQSGQWAGNFTSEATVSTAMTGISALMTVGKNFSVSGNKIIAQNTSRLALDTIQLTNNGYKMLIPVEKPPRDFVGQGTKENPYLISSVDDLLTLSDLANASVAQTFKDKYFRLTTDLDMNGVTDFYGIAAKNVGAYISTTSTPPHYFAGHFDGGGHTIKNMRIAGIKYDPQGNVIHYATMGGSIMDIGFFGILYDGGSVENLILDSSCSIDGYMCVGGIAGFMGANTSITNCINKASVTCFERYGGGIAGYAYASKIRQNINITGCINTGKIRVNNSSAGGILGDSRGVISDCINAGEVIVEFFSNCVSAVSKEVRRAGGITGANTGDIIRCANFGTVYADSIVAGGITGYNSNGISDLNSVKGGLIRECYNVGPVGAKDMKQAGAIAGEDYHVTGTEFNILFSNCLYDNQYSLTLGAQGVDAEGISPVPTDSLVSGKALPNFDDYVFSTGYYPLPKALSSLDLTKRIASTFIYLPGKQTIGNFVLPAQINTTMALNASISSPAFYIEDGYVKVNPVQEVTQADLILKNGTYTRHLPLTTLPSVFSGEGTKESPYVIASVEDFNKIGPFMAESGFDFEGKYFSLTADIDFASADTCYTIGSTNIFFNGTFEGNNHTIKNFKMPVADQTTDVADGGIFGGIGSRGELRNLKASGVHIYSNLNGGIFAGRVLGRIIGCSTDNLCSVTVTPGRANGLRPGKKGEYAGGITGLLTPTGYIGQCINGATVTGNKRVGGIIGATGTDLGAVVEDCTNEGTISAVAPTETETVGGQPQTVYVDAMAGGLVGQLTGNVRRCINRGHILTTKCSAVGGIVGSGLITAFVDSCTNEGLIESAWEFAGGIFGTSSYSSSGNGTKINKCKNNGRVLSLSGAGGILGHAQIGAEITSSSNFGSIESTSRAGGLVGQSDNTVKISDSYNAGEIKAEGRAAAGLIGEITTGGLTMAQCFNIGSVVTVNVNGIAGGLINVATGPAAINDCYNAGEISAQRLVGGLAGDPTQTTFTRCYNAGLVTCTNQTSAEKYAGNLFGRSGATAINCYYPDWLPAFSLDASLGGEKISNARLIDSRYQLGDAYSYSTLALPRLKSTAETDGAKAFSVLWSIPDGNTLNYLVGPLKLGSLTGTSWKASGMISIDGSNAIVTGNGTGTLTATCGDFSRTFTFACSDGQGGVEIIAEGELTDVRWYNLNGLEIKNPSKGDIVIMSGINAQGKRIVRKIHL